MGTAKGVLQTSEYSFWEACTTSVQPGVALALTKVGIMTIFTLTGFLYHFKTNRTSKPTFFLGFLWLGNVLGWIPRSNSLKLDVVSILVAWVSLVVDISLILNRAHHGEKRFYNHSDYLKWQTKRTVLKVFPWSLIYLHKPDRQNPCFLGRGGSSYRKAATGNQ